MVNNDEISYSPSHFLIVHDCVSIACDAIQPSLTSVAMPRLVETWSELMDYRSEAARGVTES
jgi:hypothetical protein